MRGRRKGEGARLDRYWSRFNKWDKYLLVGDVEGGLRDLENLYGEVFDFEPTTNYERVDKENLLNQIATTIADFFIEDEYERLDDASTSVYTFKQGQRADAFKQYLRDRGLYFEPSQDGRYVVFVVFNADEAVDRRAIEITRTLRDIFEGEH